MQLSPAVNSLGAASRRRSTTFSGSCLAIVVLVVARFPERTLLWTRRFIRAVVQTGSWCYARSV